MVGAQPGPFPHGGAQGCGVMEELSFGCFEEPPGLLQDLKVLDPPPPPGQSITAFLWLLQESWNGLGWKGSGMPLPRPGSLERAPTSRG